MGVQHHNRFRAPPYHEKWERSTHLVEQSSSSGKHNCMKATVDCSRFGAFVGSCIFYSRGNFTENARQVQTLSSLASHMVVVAMTATATAVYVNNMCKGRRCRSLLSLV